MHKTILNTISLGIMQGRLSPKKIGYLQTFPYTQWRDEFCRANELGFKFIEWLVDEGDWLDNPLSDLGLMEEIKLIALKNNIKIETLCAHFLINNHLLLPIENINTQNSILKLNTVIDHAYSIGISDINIPFCEIEDIIFNINKYIYLKKNLNEINNKCFFNLELSLSSIEILKLINYLNNDKINICYDIGNAFFLGYNIISDFKILKQYIRVIHIKDRRINGDSVDLGEGDTPIIAFLNFAIESGYSGKFTLETPVFPSWINCIKNNINFLKTINNIK
ncbi:MAG: sugar phosphate isomerase/epimerase [Bifidobacteriaceae bacterium]|jgi:hexulose-6-phosphate isomerase|nr:sugar phosphate isomerase/epimerase [Bifidobacteriaceae bacterium]